jgi:hypothetical protein
MGKYVTDIPTTNPDRAVERVEEYLAKQGFWKTGRPGKEFWKRISTALLSPEYVSITAGDGHVHLEAWIKAVTLLPRIWIGNTNPHKGAPLGVPSKERLRKRLDHIERLVR